MIFIGLGHKARHGKDTLAEMFIKRIPGSIIVHWADSLKNEISNAERNFPLITKELGRNGEAYFKLLDSFYPMITFKYILISELPYLDEIFTKRNITEYWGMNEKDSPMLQFWGTDFRRNLFSKDYWINKTRHEISERALFYESKNKKTLKYVLIPDTRFKNEADFLMDYNINPHNRGYYINITRTNKNKFIFYDPERDKTHPSETDLDGYKSDLELIAESGNVIQLEQAYLDLVKKVIV